MSVKKYKNYQTNQEYDEVPEGYVALGAQPDGTFIIKNKDNTYSRVLSTDSRIPRMASENIVPSINTSTGIDMYSGANNSKAYETKLNSMGNTWFFHPQNYIYDGYFDTDTHNAVREGGNMVGRGITDLFLLPSGAKGAFNIGKGLVYGGKQLLNKGLKTSAYQLWDFLKSPNTWKTLISSPTTHRVIDDITLGTLGAVGTDKISQNITGKTWGENVSEMSGYPRFLSELTNPAGMATVSKYFNQVSKFLNSNLFKDIEKEIGTSLTSQNIANYKNQIIQRLNNRFPGQGEGIFDYITDYLTQVDELADAGFHFNFDPVKAQKVFDELPVGESSKGLWGIPGTDFEARFNSKGDLHINMFGNKINYDTGQPIVSSSELRKTLPLRTSPELSGAVLSASDEIPFQYREISEAPRDPNLPTMLDLDDVSNRRLVKKFAKKLREAQDKTAVNFNDYSPSSLEILYNTAKKPNRRLFYPLPEEDIFNLNELHRSKVKNDVAVELIKAIRDGNNLDELSKLTKITNLPEIIAKYRDLVAKGKRSMKQAVAEAYIEGKFKVDDIIESTGKYPAMKVTNDVLYNPGQESVDAFNAYYQNIPGFRPFRLNNDGEVVGQFPTILYKKNGGRMLQPKWRKNRLKGNH